MVGNLGEPMYNEAKNIDLAHQGTELDIAYFYRAHISLPELEFGQKSVAWEA